MVESAITSKGQTTLPKLVIVAAARRSGAEAVYTFDRQAAQLEGAVLMTETKT